LLPQASVVRALNESFMRPPGEVARRLENRLGPRTLAFAWARVKYMVALPSIF
jgi:hypothetical protein